MGGYIPTIVSAFARTIEQGDLVWDVGANIGSYSLIAVLQGHMFTRSNRLPTPSIDSGRTGN